MGDRFDSNMTQEVSGREGQLGPAPGIPPAPAEAWPTQTLCSALPRSSGGHLPSGTRVIGQEGPACHLALGTLAPAPPPMDCWGPALFTLVPAAGYGSEAGAALTGKDTRCMCHLPLRRQGWGWQPGLQLVG